MRKTIWTTATAAALALGAFAILTTSAQASTPKAKFSAMKKALAARQDKTMISMTVVGDPSGKPKMKIMIDGQLIDVPAGVPFEYQDGNRRVVVSSNLDDLSPEERAMVEKTMKKAGTGAKVFTATSSVVVNGKELKGKELEAYLKKQGGPQHGSSTSVRINSSGTGNTIMVNGKELKGKEAEDFLKKNGGGLRVGSGQHKGVSFIDINFDFTLDEKAYSKMAFGKDENTLFLTPNRRTDMRYALAVDPKTNLPTTVTLQKSKAGKWTSVNSSKFQYKAKAKK